MSGERSIRVFCVDDHPVVRSGLRTLIESQPDMRFAGEASRAEEAAEAITGLELDLVLLDLRLPGVSGSDAVRFLLHRRADLKIIVLSTFGGDVQVRRCLEAGARAYLLKDAAAEELLEAVREVSAGREHVTARLADALETGVTHLTGREEEVLQMMARGLRNKEIAHELGLQVETVKWYVKSIHSKLKVSDRIAAILSGFRRGVIAP